MADPQAATVDVPDDGVITVDLTDNPALADTVDGSLGPNGETFPAANGGAANGGAVAEPAEPKQPRQRKPSAAEEAAAALTQQIKTYEATAEAEKKRREAAEATADAERKRREDAQRLADQRGQEAKGYREEAESRQLTIISNGIEAATQELASIKAAWRAAQEAGEFDKSADAMARAAEVGGELARLKDAKAQFEADAARKTTEGPVIAQQQQPQTAFEQYVGNFAPRAQNWLRSHPDCVPPQIGGDRVKHAKMMQGHYAAVAALGENAQGTDEYFRMLDDNINPPAQQQQQAEPQQQPAQRQQPKPRIAQPSAPVSREPPNTNGSQSRTTRQVSLNKEQQDAALMSASPRQGESEQDFKRRALGEYARNLIELEAEGKMGRLTH